LNRFWRRTALSASDHAILGHLDARQTLDGTHIATADLHGADALVATDMNMRKCAAAIGLKLYP
jgi:hypothetical protein